jgi:hypothetical protein
LAYITSSYTYINITYILSQHIDRINIININTKNTCKHIWISKKVYTHIYIKASPAIRMFTYNKNTLAHRPVPHLGTKIGSPAYQKQYTKYIHTIRGPLAHPQLPLPQEEVVAHPYLPQAVVVEHLQDPPAPAAGVH